MRMTLNPGGCAVFLYAIFVSAWISPAQCADDYQDLDAVEKQIQTLASSNRNAASVELLQDHSGAKIICDGVHGEDDVGGKTFRNIFLLKIATGNGVSVHSKILITGTQHAREWVSYVTVLYAANFLLSNRTELVWPADASEFDYFRQFPLMNIEQLLKNTDVYVIPIVNAQGYQYSKDLGHIDWRKNRRDVHLDPPFPNPEPQPEVPVTHPLEGVDLNRNYPADDWGSETPVLDSDGDVYNTTSRTRWEDVFCGRPNGGSWGTVPARAPFPGGPVMEKETDGIVTLCRSNNFSGLIDVHSSHGVVGWAEQPDDTNSNLRPNSGFSDKDVLTAVATEAAGLIIDPVVHRSYEPLATPYKSAETPPARTTSGDILIWEYLKQSNKQCMPFLIEIGVVHKFRPSDPTTHAKAVLPGLLFMMFASIDRSFAAKPGISFSKRAQH